MVLAITGLLQRRHTGDGWRWIVDAHRDDGRRYIVHFDELLSAFLALGKVSKRSLGTRTGHIFGVRFLTAGLYFFRLHTNRVFIGRYTAPGLASVDLSKFSAEEQYLRRIINP